ncbi:protein Vhl-like [Panonychus citri]|uniref:protein Vhl-like n=1 Tax=Panonychus citri TaxID=50023 RepID=UPI00230804A9|nr:protein Vhl-like [Panonychus citri]
MAIGLSSKEANKRVFLNIYNLTTHAVELIWIDYEGKEQTYSILVGPKNIEVDTFETHPWIFRESRTRKRLAVFQGTPGYPKKVLLPETAKPSIRKPVFITHPIENLRDICYLSLKRSGLKPHKIQQFDIPRELKIGYKKFLKRCIAL